MGQLEIFFDHESSLLKRIKISFRFWEGVKPWQKLLNLSWIDWVARTPLATVRQELNARSLPFRLISYQDDSQGILLLKSPASIIILYDDTGTPNQLYLDFHSPNLMLSIVKSLNSFNF